MPNPGATLLLGVLFLVANVANALYAAGRVEPSPAFFLLYYFGFAFAVWYWISTDSRRLGVAQVLDQGWFTVCAWPIALPYHLFKTRGLRGGLTLLGLLALFLATYALSLVVFLLVGRGGSAE